MSNKLWSQGIRIRGAVEQDAPAIGELCSQLGYPAENSQVASRLRRVLQQGDHAVFIAEQADRDVLAWLHLRLVSTLVLDRLAEIDGLVVREGYRGQGIGSMLLQRAEEWSIQNGCPALRLRTNVTRLDAHRFYARCGFENVKTSYLFQKPLDERKLSNSTYGSRR
jgi:GNAT superfamily N-acetyltransferase